MQDLPKSSPSESTLRRRLAEWTTKGIFIEVWSRLAELADELVRIDWSQLIADGTFCPAKKGELVADGHKRKGTIALVLMDNRQTPLAVNPQFRSEDSASRLTVKRFQSLAAANSA